MGLRDIGIPRAEIEVGKSTFSVRGITLADITQAAVDYGPQMAILFGRLQNKENLASESVSRLVMRLGSEFPGLLAATIALAADDYSKETVKIAAAIPLPKQAEAIEEIFKLTFTSEAEVKKLIESIARMIVGVSGALIEMRASASELGIGESDDKSIS